MPRAIAVPIRQAVLRGHQGGLSALTLAQRFQLPVRTVYRLLRSGELDLPVIRVDSSPRVRRLDLEQHLARLAADEEEAAAARRERAALLLRPRQRVPTARR